MDPIEHLLAERACRRLLLDLIRRLDFQEPASVAELFTEADRLSRRLMSNVLVEVTSADTASATSYFTTYRVDGYDGGTVPAGPPVRIGHYEDAFRRSAEGDWLLQARTVFLPCAGPTPRL
ncbi:nuclear transport factor 2 family protein [Streptomyces bobili]|uniref:nuclear transport factor 2 family protein n=1 Tax=Streptomyces bobili TaxID=67280 RepID=UPI0037901D9A